MKLHILSDLHLEFSKFEPPQLDADVIILAGDIYNDTKGLEWAREKFPDQEYFIYVPGNHEFYGLDRLGSLQAMREVGRELGVDVLDNDELIISGVRFLGSTLWTDFRLFGDSEEDIAWAKHGGQRILNDFRGAIHENYERFTTSRSVELHEESLAWLTKKLDEPFNGKTIVVTHHMPSQLSVVPRFKNEVSSACFASNLDHLFGKMDLWIHGHTHDNLDYVANGTRVICNPRGYVTYRGQENFEFDPEMVVEI